MAKTPKTCTVACDYCSVVYPSVPGGETRYYCKLFGLFDPDPCPLTVKRKARGD